MNKYEFTDKLGLTWERVDKRAAKRAFSAGELIRACACNIRPDSPMGTANFRLHNDGETFEYYENMLYAYSIDAGECGRYPAYYVRKPFTVHVRAPRFSQGGAGYVTGDTLELSVNGRPVNRRGNSPVFDELAAAINKDAGADLTAIVRAYLW